MLNRKDFTNKTKSELRALAKEWRSNLTKHDILRQSRKISETLEAIDWSSVESLHCYLPIAKNNEIDPRIFLSWLENEHPEIKLFTSIYDSENKLMKHVEIENLSQLDYNDSKLDDAKPANGQKFDAILVPCLMTDESNNRLGYGGGNYDRFLSDQTQALKIGLCLPQLQIDQLPNEDHDIRLDKVITE